MLTAKDIDGFTHGDKPYRVSDSYGLSLVVHPNGSKYWLVTVTIDGKRTTRQLGKYPAISAVAARKKAAELNSGKNRENSGKTFRTLAEEWHGKASASLSSRKYAEQIWSRLENDVFPSLGLLDAARIDRQKLIGVVMSVANRGAVETARRLSGYIERILDYGVDSGLFKEHHGANLERVLPTMEKGHHASLSPQESGELFKAVWGYQGGIVVASAIRMLCLTFVRSSELVGARWGEIDGDLWVIPASRMKLRKPHVVPLSEQARNTLYRLKEATGDKEYVFASRVRHINAETPRITIQEMGFKGRQTAHGLRSIFSSAAYESKMWSAGAIERQLAHKETDEVVEAYNRAEFLEERIAMMQWWADWIQERIDEKNARADSGRDCQT